MNGEPFALYIERRNILTETELEKKWENTVWDTDVYLDDIDDWGVCKDCALKENCAEYKPNKLQCEDYERYKEILTNEEWLRQASNEELEKLFEKAQDYGATCSNGDKDKCSYCGCPWCEMGFAKWLKEKHDDNMGRNP